MNSGDLPAPRLAARGVSKSFGQLVVLDSVDFEFFPGEVHAVLGENGAGKSTLMNILAGFLAPDEGRIELEGKALRLGDPLAARKSGIEMVHQHFMLVPAFSVGENLALARLEGRKGWVQDHDLAAKALKIGQELGWEFDEEITTGTLPVGTQQRLEILKALGGDARVLILDEPTAVLTPEEVVDLQRVLRQLKQQGMAIVLIAHKLSEVMSSADRVSVLRRGKVQGMALIHDVTPAQLTEWMVGELPALRSDESPTHKDVAFEVMAVSVKGDRGEPAVRGVHLRVNQGEILGVGGVDGNGQVELAEALAGVRLSEGSFQFSDGSQIQLAYIPPDRQRDGLALRFSIRDNLLVGTAHRRRLRRGPLLNLSAVTHWAREVIDRYQVKADSPATRVDTLSGGNQQKIVVGRALSETPNLVVAVNPTRGLDVRAAAFVQQQLRDVAAAGAAVLLFSTDSDELAAVAHRRVFMSRGEVREGGAEQLVGAGP